VSGGAPVPTTGGFVQVGKRFRVRGEVEQRCTDCAKWKSLDQFYGRKDGNLNRRRSKCKPCYAVWGAGRRKLKAERVAMERPAPAVALAQAIAEAELR